MPRLPAFSRAPIEGSGFRPHKGPSPMHYRIVLPIALACLAAGSVHAQPLPRLPAGAGLPDISKMGLPNVAGVLGYCVKNKFLGASGASSVINGLKGRPGVTSSPEFSAGEAGNIIP